MKLVIDPRITTCREITFRMFRRVVSKRGWDPGSLGKEIGGENEAPTDFFRRVWDTANDSTVIPYRSVLKFYFEQKGLGGSKSGG